MTRSLHNRLVMVSFLSRIWRDALLLVGMIAAYLLFGLYVLPHLGIST